MNLTYLVVIERGDSSFGASCPDLPGVIAVGESYEEALTLIREAVAFHVAGLVMEGMAVPEPRTMAAHVETSVA